ncbi:MAG TPA: reverse transcriptase family protein, partial [Candidatus Babeliaceae bacterium]|nr:reverse transcriptase family protein [Candidatus Babeliaceae bacterium]
YPFVIVDEAAHDVIIGRDITGPANITILNSDGTRLIQAGQNRIQLEDEVKIFKIKDSHVVKNSEKIINSISAVFNTIMDENRLKLNPAMNISEKLELPPHMQEVHINKDIPGESYQKLINLLVEYQDIFFKPGDPINKLNTTLKHKIRLVDGAKPVQAKLYALPLKYREAITQQVNSWLKLQIIKPSYSPWSATCVVVDKKDQILGRVCGNFQPLNNLTVNDAYPIKRIEDQKESFHGCKYFSSIDLKDAYLQVELDEESKELTAIVTHDGLFQFERMIQGLKTAPATFHRIIDSAFKSIIDKYLAAYFDDLTVHSQNIDDHLVHLRETFAIMREFGFKAKASKVHLAVTELSWLGYMIFDGQIKPDIKLVSAISNLAVPKDVNEVRMVTGLFNFYRNFIPKFATRCAPLDKLKRSDVNFEWGKEQQTAFDDLKQALMAYPVLRLPDMSKDFILDTDASTIGIGGILQQQDEATKKNYVVSYYSRKINDAEKKLGITDLEALALRDSISKFRKYLIGKKFTVYTDHISLTYLQKLSNLSGKLGRVSLELQSFDFEIKYKPGIQHVNVDCLSRMPEDIISNVFTTTRSKCKFI